ncbi:MAG: PAS domain-containing sensor histidine kinase [Archaeoglobaceae archaeon]
MDWKSVVDELSAAVVIINGEGRVTYVNKILLERSGLDYEEAVTNPHKYFIPEDYEKLAQYVLETFLQKRKNPDPAIIIRAITSKGEIVWIEARARYAEIDGKPFCILTYTDVSERIKLQKKVESLNEYLRFLNSMLRHDISNIFTRIQSYCELLEEEYTPEYVKKILESIIAGSRLIKKVRELESSAVDVKKPYKLSEVIKEVSSSFEIKVRIEGDAIVIANEGIYSVFENLFSNAIKHGRATEVNIRVMDGVDHWEILFSDNGTGIAKEYRHRIFERGFTTGGSGLGLFIVKKLIESYNGEIELGDHEKGTLFIIRLPKYSPDNQTTRNSASLQSESSSTV